MGAAAAFGALALKVGQWIVRALRAARKSDIEFSFFLRDELWKEIGRLREELREMKDRADDCDQRALECMEENASLRERVTALEARAGA